MRKNSKKLTEILNNPDVSGAKFTLENYFAGQPIEGQALRDWFLRFYDSIRVSETSGRITLSLHSNCWVEILGE
jgi:hypothetical protein